VLVLEHDHIYQFGNSPCCHPRLQVPLGALLSGAGDDPLSSVVLFRLKAGEERGDGFQAGQQLVNINLPLLTSP